MNRIRGALVALVLSVAGAGCDRPTEADCRQAVENINRILGIDENDPGADVNAAVRTCRSRSSREAVACWKSAQTRDDVAACEAKAR